MALEDLADQVDDYICTFEGLGDIVMDSLAMFIFIWALFVLFLIWLGKFLYQKYVKKASGSPVADTATSTLVKQASVVSGLPIRKSEPRDIGITKTVSPLSGASKPMRADTPLGGPQMRKRLSRKSPGPELRSISKSRLTPVPQHVLGQDPQSTQWATKTFRWLYSDLTIVNEVINTWVTAVNDFIRHDIKKDDAPIVEVVRVLPESPAPTLSNIYCEPCERTNEVMLSIDCEANPVLQAKAVYDLNGRAEVSHYKITVGRFRARFNVNVNFIALKGSMRVEGYPDIKLVINPVGAIKTSKEEANVQTALNEMLIYAMRETVYPIDFSLYSTCPRGMDIEPSYDSYSMTTSEEEFNLYRATRSPTVTSQTTSTRRLLVKVTRGEGLKSAKNSYCVIEMDEPPQKNQTNSKPGESPHWDEHFLFNLNPNSAEILFEVYDSPMRPDGPPKFLGLGLVGIDELSLGLASTQILVLQPRPYETEEVHGSVTVEFVFIEGAPIEVRRQELMTNRPNRQSTGFSPASQAFNGIEAVSRYLIRDFSLSSTATPSDSEFSSGDLSSGETSS